MIFSLLLSYGSFAQVSVGTNAHLKAGTAHAATVRSSNAAAKAARVTARSTNTNHGATVRTNARTNGAAHVNANAKGSTEASGAENTLVKVRKEKAMQRERKMKEKKMKERRMKEKVKTEKERRHRRRSADAHAKAELKSNTKVKAEKK